MRKLHNAMIIYISARSVVGCNRLTYQLHDCSCIHLTPIAETAAKACHPYDYNDIHTQTSPIFHEYHCSKS